MSDEPKATIYTDRLKWLIAKTSDSRHAWDDGAETPKYFGLANTEHQFRQALCLAEHPDVRKLSARDIQEAIAEELAALGASK